MGTPTDLTLAIPGSGPPVAVPDTAGDDSEPMDENTIYQPVVAYFTFIQNNRSDYQREHTASNEGS